MAMLAAGEPLSRIQDRAQACREVIQVVREQEYGEIQRRKELIRAQAANVATEAFDQLSERLRTEKVPTQMLVPIAGMAADKVHLLSPPETQTLQVNHTIEPGPNLYAKLESLAQRLAPARTIQATIIDNPEVA